MGKRADKKLKEKQAMTARQRKERRAGSDFAEQEPELTPVQAAENRRVRNRILLIAVSLILAIAVTVGAVIPVWYYSDYKYEKNPIVVMELTSGMTLRYEVFPSDAHNSATNFLFLCNIGYFNGSLIHDTQESGEWVHFGGYYLEDGDTLLHRSADAGFLEKTANYFTDNKGETQFKYRVAQDRNGMTSDMDAAVYGLFGNYNRYCTEFEILGARGANARYTNKSSPGTVVTFTPVYIARAYDDETKENIETILGMSRSETVYRNYFTPPEPIITIKSTKVRNYAPAYGKSFETYMTDKGAISSGTWSNYYL